MTGPLSLRQVPALDDHAGWLKWLQAEFPTVGFVHTGAWFAMVGKTSWWSAATAWELEGVLRRTRIPRLPNILPARRIKAG